MKKTPFCFAFIVISIIATALFKSHHNLDLSLFGTDPNLESLTGTYIVNFEEKLKSFVAIFLSPFVHWSFKHLVLSLLFSIPLLYSLESEKKTLKTIINFFGFQFLGCMIAGYLYQIGVFGVSPFFSGPFFIIAALSGDYFAKIKKTDYAWVACFLAGGLYLLSTDFYQGLAYMGLSAPSFVLGFLNRKTLNI